MNGKVMVDASLALKWVIPETDSSAALSLLNKWVIEEKGIIAPALFAYEVTNILFRQSIATILTYDEAKQSLKKLFSIGIVLKFTEYEEISVRAMEFAQQFALNATYDSHYLALAQTEKCAYWTADTRLWNAVKNKLDWVYHIGNYRP